MIGELGISGDAIRDALIASFKRTDDTGVMSESEAADFIILELSGDVDKAKALAVKLAKKALAKAR